MSGRDLFGVVVRTTGLASSLYGTYCGIWGFLVAVSPDYWLGVEYKKEGLGAGHFLVSALILIVDGKVMLMHAEFVVRIAYPQEKRTASDESMTNVNPPVPPSDPAD